MVRMDASNAHRTANRTLRAGMVRMDASNAHRTANRTLRAGMVRMDASNAHGTANDASNAHGSANDASNVHGTTKDASIPHGASNDASNAHGATNDATNDAAVNTPDVIANDVITNIADAISNDTVADMPDASAVTANVAAGSARPRSGQPRRRKDAVVHTRTVEPGGLGVSFDLQTAIIDNVKDDSQGHALGVKPSRRISKKILSTLYMSVYEPIVL